MNASLHVLSNSPGPSLGAPANLRLRVGEHVVDLGALRVVTNPGAPRLSSKAAAVLVELARHAGDTVTRDALLDHVWKDRVTTPDVLTQAIKELRRAFVDDAKPPRYIETVPKVGYRLLVPVAEIDPDVLPTRAQAALPPANDDPAIASRVVPRPVVVRFRRRNWIAMTAALLVLGVVALFARAWLASAHRVAWTARDVRALTSEPGAERRPRISPDGTRIAYSKLDPDSGFERLVVRGVDPSQPAHPTRRAIAHEEGPVWSPDGTRIAFERLDNKENCTLYVVPSMGGADDEVGPCGDYRINYYDWTPDGKSLIVSDQLATAGGGLPIALLDLATGERRALHYQRAASDLDLDAHYSPDGRWIAFRRGLSPHSDLFLMAAEGGAVRQLTHLDARIAGHTWTPDGNTLVFAGNQDGAFALYTLDLRSAHVQTLSVRPAAFPNMARNGGKVLYEIQRTRTLLASAALAPDDHAIVTPNALHLLALSTGSDTAPTYSPDGKQVAFVSDRNGAQELWRFGLDESSEPQLLTDYRDAVISNPVWSRDGTHLLATVREQGRTRLTEIDIASRRSRTVAVSQVALLYGDYGPQPGSYLLLRRAQDAHSELVVLEHADSAQESIVPIADGVEHAELDRANATVFYTKSNEPGLFRRALDGGAEQLVTRKITANILDGWRIIDGHVWYVSGFMQKPFDLREFDPQSGTERARLHVDAWLRDVNFDVSPNREQVLLAPMGPEDIDVGAFTLEQD